MKLINFFLGKKPKDLFKMFFKLCFLWSRYGAGNKTGTVTVTY